MRLAATLDLLELRKAGRTPWRTRLVTLATVIVTVIAIVLILATTSRDARAFVTSISSNFAAVGFWVPECTVIFVPLALASLGVGLARRAGFWNIGGEAQILLGALGGFLLARLLPDLRAPFSQTLAIVAAFIFGACACGLFSLLKTHRGADEVLTTLLSNFLVLHFIAYLVGGPLRDPESKWIQSSTLFEAYRFARISGFGRMNTSIVVLIIGSVCFLLLERRTSWSTLLKLNGDNPNAVSALRIDPNRVILGASLVSGGLCGMAGWIELAGNQYRLVQDLSPGYGFYAILVAVIGGGTVLRTLLTAVVFALLLHTIDGVVRDAGVPVYMKEAILGLGLLVYVVNERLRTHSFVVRPH